jgi:rubrerythrin
VNRLKGKSDVKVALSKALGLEQQGFLFYTESAKRTVDESGSQMFWWLAGEEKKHFMRILEAWAENLPSEKPPEFNPDAASFNYLVFVKKFAGGEDELDALNTGIHTEEASIALYSLLAENKDLSPKARKLFETLVREEEKHLAILNKEVEFVTKTGEYTDFRTVTT